LVFIANIEVENLEVTPGIYHLKKVLIENQLLKLYKITIKKPFP
jgi:hypothetical protein